MEKALMEALKGVCVGVVAGCSTIIFQGTPNAMTIIVSIIAVLGIFAITFVGNKKGGE